MSTALTSSVVAVEINEEQNAEFPPAAGIRDGANAALEDW